MNFIIYIWSEIRLKICKENSLVCGADLYCNVYTYCRRLKLLSYIERTWKKMNKDFEACECITIAMNCFEKFHPQKLIICATPRLNAILLFLLYTNRRKTRGWEFIVYISFTLTYCVHFIFTVDKNNNSILLIQHPTTNHIWFSTQQCLTTDSFVTNIV